MVESTGACASKGVRCEPQFPRGNRTESLRFASGFVVTSGAESSLPRTESPPEALTVSRRVVLTDGLGGFGVHHAAPHARRAAESRPCICKAYRAQAVLHDDAQGTIMRVSTASLALVWRVT